MNSIPPISGVSATPGALGALRQAEEIEEAEASQSADDIGGTPPPPSDPPSDLHSESLSPSEPESDKKGFSWGKYGAWITGGVGILAWIGSLFSSEEGSKGKGLLAGIGGLLVGGALLAKYPDNLAWLFGGGKKQDQAPQPAEQT